MDEAFSEGKILMGNTLYEGVQLRYNIYNDRFEARLLNTTIELDPLKTPIDTLYYAGYRFVLKFMQPGTNKDLSHLLVLYHHADFNLFKKLKITLTPETKPGAYAEGQPAQFNPSLPEYYLERGEEMVLVKGAKSIAEFFEVEPKEVKSLIRSGQSKLQREEDLVRICTHFSNVPSTGN